MNAIEILGFIFSLSGIGLATREHVLTWPLQIAASLLYVVLFVQVNLFGESLLQLAYAVIAAYGWCHWRKGASSNTQLSIRRLSRKEWCYINLFGLAALLGVAQFQIQFLPTDVPYLDSSIFVFGLLAQWMQAQKRLENWLYWIVLDLVCAGIYAYKALFLTAVLYLILTALAWLGWQQWRRKAA